MKKDMILPIICLIWLVFLQNWNMTIRNKTYSYKVSYNGLLWVGLDYYTIIKYQSNDEPMKWIKYKRTKVQFRIVV